MIETSRWRFWDEHLSISVYRCIRNGDAAIAELVANAWDVGAKNVQIVIPKEHDYNPTTSQITITDDGLGMDEDQVQSHYLIIGRNRRKDGGDISNGRKVMGRKGIGKLAGFGIAREMILKTWQHSRYTSITMDIEQLKVDDAKRESIPIPGKVGATPMGLPESAGTRLTLKYLKAKSVLKDELLVSPWGGGLVD